MKDHNLRKSNWKEKIINSGVEIEENLSYFMPKVFPMTLDNSSASGCIEERPGYLMMNVFIRDMDTPGDD